MHAKLLIGLVATVAVAASLRINMTRAAEPTTKPAEDSALNFDVKTIDGQPVNLSQYRGNVVLIVNVASKCGNTPQYAGLETIYKSHKDDGFTILGFPADNFAHQEPGSDEQIKRFCTSKYDVTFPMFSKISVKGDDSAPLYQYLTHQPTQPQAAGDISWNFEKFLIGRDGKVAARFSPKTQPSDPGLVKMVEMELAKPKP